MKNYRKKITNNTFFLWEIPRNYFLLYFSKERAYIFEGYRMLAFLSIDVKRDLIDDSLIILSLDTDENVRNLSI
jgi:hypothetical protein